MENKEKQSILSKYLDGLYTGMKVSMFPTIAIVSKYTYTVKDATVWQTLGVMFFSLVCLTLIIGYTLIELKDYFKK